MFFMGLATRYAGLKPFQDAYAGTGSFEDECFKYAGEKIIDWVEKGYFPEGVNSLKFDDGQDKQLMYQETAAMTLQEHGRPLHLKQTVKNSIRRSAGSHSRQ